MIDIEHPWFAPQLYVLVGTTLAAAAFANIWFAWSYPSSSE